MRAAGYDPSVDADTDLFACLGAPWEAPPDELKECWRRALFGAHPDTGGSHEQMLKVQYAWEVLSDSGHRAGYLGAQRVRSVGKTSAPPPKGAGSSGTSRRQSGKHGPSPSGNRCTGFTVSGARCSRPPAEDRERCWQHIDQPDEEVDRLRRKLHERSFCLGNTADGLPCSNWSREGSAYCRHHEEGGSRPGSQGEESGRVEWRCSASKEHRGLEMGCIFNRLLGSTYCWDHSSSDERTQAKNQAAPGHCASVTQRGTPCRKGRNSLGYPACDSHLTSGMHDEYFGTARSSTAGSPRRPPSANSEPGPAKEGETPNRPPTATPAQNEAGCLRLLLVVGEFSAAIWLVVKMVGAGMSLPWALLFSLVLFLYAVTKTMG